MLTGLHAIVFDPEAGRGAFFRDTLALDSVDTAAGWPIFAMPPAEPAVHPDAEPHHGLYLMCDDIERTLAEPRAKDTEVARAPRDAGWGLLAAIRMPDGSDLPIYEPRHPSPILGD